MKHVLLLVLVTLVTGCSISNQYRLNPATDKIEQVSSLSCWGLGCDADHEAGKIAGGSLIPKLPINLEK